MKIWHAAAFDGDIESQNWHDARLIARAVAGPDAEPTLYAGSERRARVAWLDDDSAVQVELREDRVEPVSEVEALRVELVATRAAAHAAAAHARQYREGLEGLRYDAVVFDRLDNDHRSDDDAWNSAARIVALGVCRMLGVGEAREAAE